PGTPTLSLHDALPICDRERHAEGEPVQEVRQPELRRKITWVVLCGPPVAGVVDLPAARRPLPPHRRPSRGPVRGSRHPGGRGVEDRKSTRLNSSHLVI